MSTGLVLMLLTGCSISGDDSGTGSFDLAKIRLPDGFEISVFAENVPGARSMARTPSGIVFVGTRNTGVVYAVVDENSDGRADRVWTVDEGLTLPNGVAFRDGSLFVAERSRILRYDAIEDRLDNPPDPVVVYGGFPDENQHGWKYIAFGPDDKLYVPVGAPCNVCDDGDPFASIMRMNPDGTELEIFARGVRNSVGFAWHPETHDLWFTDNGRDNLGDDVPPCELNHAPSAGLHFGFPHIHGGTIPDPDFGDGYSSGDFTPPAQQLGPHVAPLGMEFYTGSQFPAEYYGQIFIAEHGSWNRSEKIGYRISLVRLDEQSRATSYEAFAEGWLESNEDVWGRPVDLEHLQDGSLLVSDDRAGVIYRIVYNGS